MENLKGRFQSTKVIDGFSTCFRQWKAKNTHCRFLHGYGISVKFVFEGELDHRNWTVDFGSFKRTKYNIIETDVDETFEFNPKDWLNWLLDHTTIIAQDDPKLPLFQELSKDGTIQLRTLPATGCEMFAQYIGSKIADWCLLETNGRCRLVSCEVREHEKNAAIWFA